MHYEMIITRDGARTCNWAGDSPAELSKAAASSGLALSTDVDVLLSHEGQLIAFARTIVFELVTWRHDIRAMPRPTPDPLRFENAA